MRSGEGGAPAGGMGPKSLFRWRENLLLIILTLSEKLTRSVQETFFPGYSADLLGFSEIAALLMLLSRFQLL